MSIYLSRWDHRYTLKKLKGHELLKSRCYDRIFRRWQLPLETYIFTDIDRLGTWELELAAIIYRKLQQAGARVLNDPASVLVRYDLLEKLHQEGLNQFQVYRPHLGTWPAKYPVFVRRNAFHSGVLSGLLQNETELREALKKIKEDGVPDSNVMVVEYAAESASDGLFRKLAVFRVGDRYFKALSVNQGHWIAKQGQNGIAGEEVYQEELDTMHEIAFFKSIKRVFEIAKIEYGRLDYGLVDGRPQFYEINTNPTVPFGESSHPYQQRVQSHRIFEENYRSAIRALKFEGDEEMVKMDHPFLKRHRKSAKPESWSHPTL